MRRRRLWWRTASLAILLAVAGCGMEPYSPHNFREEGPEKGVFTGAKGEFVIFRIEDEQKSADAPGEENGTEAPAEDDKL